MDAPILRFDRSNLPEPHILPAGLKVSLEVSRGRAHRRVRPIEGRVFLIGTASDCDLVLGDLSFPEAYAYIFVNEESVTIRRLGSGPALAVCGEETETAELFHGDLLEFGPFELRLLIELPPPPERRPRRGPQRRPLRSEPDSGQAEAIDDIWMLLADVHQALAPHPRPAATPARLERSDCLRECA